jgi:dTDP-4-dehydrorhamnose reductase
MKIILFGANGMLGSYIAGFLANRYQVFCIRRENLDIAKTSQLETINTLSPLIRSEDVIINAAGIIKQREYSIEEMIAVNSLFPHTLNAVKNRCGAEVIHITTDCVFNGSKGNYNENDLHDCVDEYGKSKSLGENLNLTNIRTSIIGEEQRNKKSLLEWVRSNRNKTIDGYENHLWNGITCLELCKFIHTVIKTKNFWTGVRHIYSPNYMSKYELATLINNVYDLKIIINKVRTQQSCNRVLETLYENPITKTLYSQILELKNYKL